MRPLHMVAAMTTTLRTARNQGLITIPSPLKSLNDFKQAWHLRVKDTNHAALLFVGSSAVILLSTVATASSAAPQIQHINAFRTAPKPATRLTINNSIPRLKNQL